MAGGNAPGFLPSFEHFATHAIHFGQEPEQWNSKAVVPPITLSTTFKQQVPGKDEEYKYIRFGNPNRHVLETVMTVMITQSATIYKLGLSSHPQYKVVKKQCTGVSGMVSFHISGKKENAIAFLKNLKSFGYTMTHGQMDAKTKEELKITDTLIRLSVGLEDATDLVQDLKQALKAAFE
ncbi:cystathionine gamma-lyase-like [Pyrgilauda ruficollis]|uniref:cystathionine gamma-lyase-like n=1 Tax=Pyrgilauda ruficollis TaxID=221976 RepID=UPI001B87A8EB|nr:cystathionine gamma-lyase-like [Pyrgilauda ruficollis]